VFKNTVQKEGKKNMICLPELRRPIQNALKAY